MAERNHWWTERWLISLTLSLSLLLSFSDYQPTNLSIYPSIYLSLSLSISISISIYLTIDRSIYLSFYLSICLSVYLSVSLSICLPVYLSLSICLPIYRLIYLSISLSLSVCLSIYLSICKLLNQRQKRNNSARLLFLHLTTSKTKQFCETSSIFELDNIKNKTILRDFFQNGK